MAKMAAIPAKTGDGSFKSSAKNNAKTIATPVFNTRAPNCITKPPLYNLFETQYSVSRPNDSTTQFSSMKKSPKKNV